MAEIVPIIAATFAAIATALVAGAWLAFRAAISRVYADQRHDRADLLQEVRESRKERMECREQLAALQATVEHKLEARHDRDARGRFTD